MYCLLIVLNGIEMCELESKSAAKVLLIVLNGIEIGVRAGDGHPLQFLLIVLNGIEMPEHVKQHRKPTSF